MWKVNVKNVDIVEVDPRRSDSGDSILGYYMTDIVLARYEKAGKRNGKPEMM